MNGGQSLFWIFKFAYQILNNVLNQHHQEMFLNILDTQV